VCGGFRQKSDTSHIPGTYNGLGTFKQRVIRPHGESERTMKRFSVMALLVVAFVLAACNVIGLDPNAGTGTPGDVMTPAQPPTDPVQPTADTGQPATVPVQPTEDTTQPTAKPVETTAPVPTEDSSAGV